MKSLGGLVAVVGVTALCAGCCTPAPPAKKYFDREEPLHALKGFAYSVETEQWDYAYASLTEATREEIGPIKFQVAVEFFHDPLSGIPVYDLITQGVTRIRGLKQQGDQARIDLRSKVWLPDGRPLYRAVNVLFRREEDEWRLDLLGTAEGMANPAAPPRS